MYTHVICFGDSGTKSRLPASGGLLEVKTKDKNIGYRSDLGTVSISIDDLVKKGNKTHDLYV